MPISRPGHQTSAPMSKTVQKIFQPFGLEEPRSEEHPAMIQSYKPEDSESGAYAISLLEKVAKERLGGPATRGPQLSNHALSKSISKCFCQSHIMSHGWPHTTIQTFILPSSYMQATHPRSPSTWQGYRKQSSSTPPK